MKKALSIIITVIMLIGIMSVCGNVFAATVIGLNEETEVSITSGGQYQYYSFTPSESGNYIIRSFENDDDTYGYLYLGSEELAYDDDSGGNANFKIMYYLEAGNTYEIRVRFYSSSDTGSFKIIVERNPLESISYNPIGQLTVAQGTHDYPDMMGDIVTFSLTDGMEIIYKVGTNYHDLVAANSDYYEGEYGHVSISLSISDEDTWSADDTDPYITYSVGNISCKVPVTVVSGVSKEIKSLSVSSPNKLEYIENVSGHSYTDGDELKFSYYFYIPVGTTVTAVFKDGSKKVFTYNKYSDFVTEDGEYFYANGSINRSNDGEWTKGGDNYFEFEYLGATAKLPVSIIANPIKSVSYKIDSPLVENLDGYQQEDDEGNKYFTYYDYGFRLNSVITLNFKDGTSKAYTCKDIDGYGWHQYLDAQGNRLPYGLEPSFSSDQEHTHWKVGKNNALTISFGTFNTEAKIEIVKNTVASVSLTLADNVLLDKTSANPVVYHEGNRIDVKYSDGSSKTYTMKWDKTNYGMYYFDGSGNRINSYYYSLSPEIDSDSPYVEVTFQGVSAKADIVIQEKAVSGIRFVPIAPIVIKESEGRKLKDGSYYYDSGLYWNKLLDDGGVMFVDFSDGTSKKYTCYLKDDNYWMFDESGSIIDYVNFGYDSAREQLFTPWTPIDENSITVEYRGVMTTVPVIIDGAYEGYKGFPDVSKDSWFYNAVKFNATRGLITGYQNGKFGPADSLQRQDFVVILARIAGADLEKYETVNSKMPDVKKGKYYAAAVNWAVDNGIITGYTNGKFGVGDKITREQVCTILYRYMHSPAVTGSDATLKPFADKGKISDFAKNPIVWAIQNGVISGKNATTLAPTATASRAEIATIIMRMVQRDMFN